MADLVSLTSWDIFAKLTPTGIALMLCAFMLKCFGDLLIKRLGQREKSVDQREARVDEAGSSLLTNALAFVSSVRDFEASTQQRLDKCLAHHAECTDRVGASEARIAVLEAQLKNGGSAWQENRAANR